MYQSTNSAYPTVQITKLANLIVGIVNDVNNLINEVTPDYSIDNETGAITGKRQRPSLTGELSYEQSQIGYLSLGFDPVNGSGSYYRDEPFNARIEETYQLTLTKLEELKANLDNPESPVTQYEIINLACTFPGIFIEALAVVLGEQGFLVEAVPMPNVRNSPNRYDGSQFNMCSQHNPVQVRTTREKFISNWKHYLTGAPFKSAFEQPVAAQTNNLPDVEVDNQADQQ